MRRSFFLTTALSALISLSAPAAHAGSHLQGPALDGREVALPDGLRIVGAPVGRIPEHSAEGLMAAIAIDLG